MIINITKELLLLI